MEELQASMSQREFIQWIEFYKIYPFDDYHRIHRPAVLIASSNGSKMQDAFEWLCPDPVTVGLSESDINTFKAFGIKPKG